MTPPPNGNFALLAACTLFRLNAGRDAIMKKLYNDPPEIRSEFSKWLVGRKWANYERFCKYLAISGLSFWRLSSLPKTAVFALTEAWFRWKRGLFPMRLSLVSDASKPNFHAGRCYLPPWQQASDHKRAAFCDFFSLEVPAKRVLFSMKNLDKT